jgi:TonB family protein
MRRWLAISSLAVCTSAMLVTSPFSLSAQQDQSESKRKMVTKITPSYPSLARTMNISGTVKIEAVVAPDGTVKSASLAGGHPLLGQAAVDAIRKSRWEVAPHETHELITVRFHPE